MKQAEEDSVVLNIENGLAGRIWTEFRNDGGQRVLAEKFNNAIQDALRKHKQTAPDEALIAVAVQLTLKEARAILAAFRPWIGYATDHRVYQAVSDAIKASETRVGATGEIVMKELRFKKGQKVWLKENKKCKGQYAEISKDYTEQDIKSSNNKVIVFVDPEYENDEGFRQVAVDQIER